MLKYRLILLPLLLLSQTTLAAIVVGNFQGSVTLTEVFDYQCGHCHQMQPLMNWLMDHDKNLKIRLIPIAVINKDSLIEATSSYVMAKNKSNFLKYHEFLMSKAVSAKGVGEALNDLRIDRKAFRIQMHQPWVLHEMQEGIALAKAYHSGTPLILIYRSDNPSNKSVFRGETDPRLIIRAIEEASFDQ